MRTASERTLLRLAQAGIKDVVGSKAAESPCARDGWEAVVPLSRDERPDSGLKRTIRIKIEVGGATMLDRNGLSRLSGEETPSWQT